MAAPITHESGACASGAPRWGAVFSLTLCVATLIASEFMPVSLLTPIAADLHMTEGGVGQAIAVSGVFAVLTSLVISSATRGVDRRTVLLPLGVLLAGCGPASTSANEATAAQQTRSGTPRLTEEWDKRFPRSDRVDHQKVTFKTRYGITLAADLYLPRDRGSGRMPALVVSGPFGAVKEQVSGLYAQTMAERGFVALAFDPSYTGESGGEPRNVASPDINTEDVSAAVDFLGLHDSVDRDRIGALGICGYSGMSLTAATSDSRIKAVATASMYDMSRSISRGHQDRYTIAQRRQIIDYLSRQRWVDAENGSHAAGYHEVPFDEQGNIVKGERGLPESLPENADPVLAAFFDYYRTDRGFHPRSVNSTTAWTATTPVSFFNFPMYANVEMISPRPILLVAGENAHSRYYSEDVYEMAAEPKELLIVPGADHVDLYDRVDLIPWDKLASFFTQHLR